jgi:hypothetical protein
MCRWLAYSGEALKPSELVLDTQHSLVAQSLNSPLGAETVNGDASASAGIPKIPAAATSPPSSTASSRPGTTRTCAS